MGEPKAVTDCIVYASPTPPRLRYGNHQISSPRTKQTRTLTNVHSEGGHDLDMITPLPNLSGASVCAFFNGVFATMIGLCTLGSSITFSFVISPISSAPGSNPLPHGSRYTVAEVQLFLAISFLLFLLTLASASLFTTMLTFFKHHWAADWDGLHGKTSRKTVQYYAIIAAGLIGSQTIAAFLFMCLVVVAFQPIVGWICFSFVGLFGALISASILYQFPWPGRSETAILDDTIEPKEAIEDLA